MERQEIIDGMRAIIDADENIDVDVSNVREDTRVDKIGFDSLSILEFMYEVESRFGVTMEVSDLVEMTVVSDMIDHVQKHRAPEHGAE